MSKEQGTGKGLKTLENILAILDEEEENGNFRVERPKLYKTILTVLENTEHRDPLMQIKILNLTSKELEKEKVNASCAVSVISVVNVILKEIEESNYEMLSESLLQSALAVSRMLKNVDGRRTPDLMKLTVETYIMYPNDTFVQLTNNFCKDVLGMFGKPEINFTLMAPVLIHLLNILPDDSKTMIMTEGIDLWFYPFLDNFPNADLLTKNIDVLELLTDNIIKVDYSDNFSWLNLLSHICDVKKYPTLLKELLCNGNACWYRLWIVFIKLLKDQITIVNKQGISPINSLLPVVEQAFKMETICRNRAFECWNALIDNFSKDLNGSLMTKRLKLLLIPLKSNNARVPETGLMKMRTWWHLIYKFNCKMENLIDTVLMPFLYYFFGKPEGVKGVLVLGQMTDEISLNCVEALIEIVGHDHDCEGCVKLPRLESKLINTKVLVEHWGEWIFFLNVAITTLARLGGDNTNQQLTCLWKGFVTTIAELPENQIRADLFSELLKMVQTLLNEEDTKMTKLIFEVLIFSLFDDSTKQLLKTKSMGHGNWGPLPCILAILQNPVMTRFTSAMPTEDLVLKLKPLTDMIVNPNYAIPETLIEWFIKNQENQEKVPILAALAESICETRYNLNVKNAMKILLYPINNRDQFSQERSEALWHRWYKLHKCGPYLGTNFYTALGSCVRVTADTPTPSNIHFIICAVLVLMERKLDDEKIPKIGKEMEILLNVLRDEMEAKLEKLMPILVAVLVRLKNISFNKEVDKENISEIVLLTLKQINRLIEISTITDGAILIENLLPSIDNIVKTNQNPKLRDNLVDRLNQTLKLVKNNSTKKAINEIITIISLTNGNTKVKSRSEIASTDNDSAKEKQCNSNFQTPEQKSAKKVKKRGVPDVVNKTNVNGEEYEVIKSNWKFNPKKLTEAQKEKLKRKREDIPALYQDLSQSQEEFSLRAWKTDSQETSSATSSKSNSKSTDTAIIIQKLPSAEVVPNIIESMLSDTAQKTKDQPPDTITNKLESPVGKEKQPKDPKTPRIALKDRVFRNVRNLIEKSGLQSPDKSPKTTKDIIDTDVENAIKSPVTKAKLIATDASPSAARDGSPNSTTVSQIPNSTTILTHIVNENITTPITKTKTLNPAKSASLEKTDVSPKLSEQNITESDSRTPNKTRTAKETRSASVEESDMPLKVTDVINCNDDENVLKTPVNKTKTTNVAKSSVKKSDVPPNQTDSIDNNVSKNVLKTTVTKAKTLKVARSASVENTDPPPKSSDNIIDNNVSRNVLKTHVTKAKTLKVARSASVENTDPPPKSSDNSIDNNVSRNVLKTPVTKAKTSKVARSASVENTDTPPKSSDNINYNVNENVLKTPVTKTKTKPNATNSASSERPSRSIKRPKKFEDTEVFELKKRRRSIGDSQHDDIPHKKEKYVPKPQALQEEPSVILKESDIVKEQYNTATEVTVPQPSIILKEQPQGPPIQDRISSHNNEVSSSQIESLHSCETLEKNRATSDTFENTSNNAVEMPEENMVSESQVTEADSCSQVNEEVSTPRPKTKKTKDADEQSAIKKKQSRIEKQLLIDTIEGHPLLQSQSSKRPSRKNIESMTKKRKSLSEKSNKFKPELELRETDTKKQKSCNDSQVITLVESEDKNSQSNEEFTMSEDVIESSQDSTLTTISVMSTGKKKIPYVVVDKLSPENQKNSESSQSIKLADDALKVTPLAKTKRSKNKLTETQQLIDDFDGDIIPLSDIELPKNKTIETKETSAENKKKESPNKIPMIRLDLNNPLAKCSVNQKRLVDVTQKLTLTSKSQEFEGKSNSQESKEDIDITKNMSADGSNEINLTETMDTEPMEDSDLMIINDEDAPIVINTEETLVGKETQELAEADTLPISQSISDKFDKDRSASKKSQDDSDSTSMKIQNDASEVSTTVELPDLIGESSNSGSPFKDNLQRKKDFLNDTIEISPIKTLSPVRDETSPSPDKSDEYVVIKLLAPVQSNGEPYNEKCDSPEIFTDDKVSPDKRDQSPPRKEAAVTNSSPSSSLSLKKNRPQMRANGRAAQMLGLCVPEKLQILNTERSENEEVRRGSPINTRAKRNLRILYNSAGENVDNEANTNCNDNETEEGERFLKFKRSLPTADCSPSGPILKRKLAEIADEATVSPASKNMIVSELQLSIFLEFLENHRDMAKGRMRSTQGRCQAKKLWDQITAILNAVEGCKKTALQWQTVWRDRKYMAKKAADDLKKTPMEVGVNRKRLHRWERRVLDIIGYKYNEPSKQDTENQSPKRELEPSQSAQESQQPNKGNKKRKSSKEQPVPSGFPMDLSKGKETQEPEEGHVVSRKHNASEKLMPEENTWESGQEKSQLLVVQGPPQPLKPVLSNPLQESPILPPPPPPPPQIRPVNLSMKSRNPRGSSQGKLPLGNASSIMEHAQEAPMGRQTPRPDVTQLWMNGSFQGNLPLGNASSIIEHAQEVPIGRQTPRPDMTQPWMNGSFQGNLPLGNTSSIIEFSQEAPMGRQTPCPDVTQPWVNALTQEPLQYASSLPMHLTQFASNGSSGNPIQGGPVPIHKQQPLMKKKKSRGRKHMQVPSEVQGPFHSNSVPLMEPSPNGPVPLQSLRFVRPSQTMVKRNHNGYPQENYQGPMNVPSDGSQMNQVPFVNPMKNGPVGRDQKSLFLNHFKDRINSRDEECLGSFRHRLLRIEEERLSETRVLKEELSEIKIMLQTLVEMLSDKIEFI